MNFGAAIENGMRNYVDFTGRASRSEYWFFFLFGFLVYIGSIMVDAVVGGGLFYVLTVLGLFLPSLSVAVRRLHDTDRSGFWYFIVLVPLVGAVLLLIWFCTEGTRGPNAYGDDPLGQSNGFNRSSRFGSYRTDDLDRLERLSEMLSRGIITQEEYEGQKAAILRTG